jgi:putative two-component system response regulator
MFKTFLDLTQQDLVDHLVLTAYVAEVTEWDNRAHLERIRRYAYILASELGMGHEQASLISLASMLHDVGKITIPVNIMKKTANLEPAEYKITERHTLEAARMMRTSGSPILQAAAVIAQTHHERWDGSGYPEQLKGEAIPLSGRIMALIDVFDSLTTWRPYKKAMPPDQARELILTSSGVLFDPKVVAAFIAKFDDLLAVWRAQN